MQRLLSVFCALLGTAHAQSPHFLVASIKPSPPPAGPSELAFQHDPGRVAFAKVNASTLIVNATGLLRNAISGPDWIDSAWFQFSATTPLDATNQQLQEMFLNFMEERFAFKYHRESHEKRGYALTVAPRGPRLVKAQPTTTDNGHAGLQWYFDPRENESITGHLPNCSLGTLAGALNRLINGAASPADRNVFPVENNTGLDGHYDITLKVEEDFADKPVFGKVSPSAVRRALEEQLGLTLKENTVTVATVVVDNMARTPTPN
jgi:uncharacterized protein (TIGR03435 family)